MKRRVSRSDLLDLAVAFGCIAFLIALYALLPWWLQAAWAVVLVRIAYVRLTRGKMDSHRRQHGAGSGNPDVPGCLSVGAEIDNTHVERF